MVTTAAAVGPRRLRDSGHRRRAWRWLRRRPRPRPVSHRRRAARVEVSSPGPGPRVLALTGANLENMTPQCACGEEQFG
ncbi:hypothetical protein I553_0936 [Mycobacterium xenopi 4042]|uniref:Uncharacterized protein n=1 Tax=Mycobacterium xenopi 4042 TaxID=1299334 RepID=X7Z8X6_MYCXE|nr:hypothetical protein I553_0936 [Mycobacterium xenopi 4042]